MSKVKNLADQAYRTRKGPGYPWWDRLDLNRDGEPKLVLHNVVVVLTEHELWRGLLRYDSLGNRIIKTRTPPYGGEAGELTDIDGGEIAAWFGDPANMGMAIKSQMAIEAAEIVANRDKVHPVCEYLESLRWDGTKRLPDLFMDYCGAVGTSYVRAVGPMFMISAVARVMEPGCKVDFMVVLEGDQGLGKSQFVRELFGAGWFAEAMESPAHKDFYQTLQGRWAIEISEMQSFSKADINKVKQAVTTQVDVYRPSYGRYTRSFPRQCIFVGTTNDDEYLRDPTGARRFLPIRCTDVNIELLRSMRDQLWAEALARYRGKEPWWNIPEEAAQEQDARYQRDSWEDVIVEWVERNAPDSHYPIEMVGAINSVTITDILQHALRMEIGKHSRPDQLRVGAILRRMGWKRKKCRVGGNVAWKYVRPSETG